MLVQYFLEKHSLKELQEIHGVEASFSKSGHKFSLNYNQISSRNSDVLAQECRGLILAAEDGKSFLSEAQLINNKLNFDHIVIGKTKILSYPMKRFFNLGQEEVKINWNDPKISFQSKRDGSLCIVYWDPFTNQWCVATRSCPEADIMMDNNLFTFRTLFEKAVQETLNIPFDTFTYSLVKDITYYFELCSPLNRIVCIYQDYSITLLGARYLPTLQELNPKNLSIVQVGGVPVPKEYNFNSIDSLVEYVSQLNPLDPEGEGIVIRDSDFNRGKSKNAKYVVYNKLHDRLGHSERNCLEMILLGKEDDIIAFLPDEITKNLLKIKKSFVQFVKDYDHLYLEMKVQADDILPNDKKTFAKLINDLSIWHAPLFNIFQGKASDMINFIEINKKHGTWSNSFLDKILDFIKY